TDQNHALFRAPEAARVLVCILTDYGTVRNDAVFVNDRVGDATVRAYAGARQYHGLEQLGRLANPYVGEQHRFTDFRAGDDAASRYQRIEGSTATPGFVEDELRGRQLFLVGPDWPLVIVQVQFRTYLRQFQVGLEKTVHRSDVTP